jgi:hypothetical protein
MDWTYNTVWFDQIPQNKFMQFDWKEKASPDAALLSDVEYLIVWHHKSKDKNLANLPPTEGLKFFELNWSSTTSFKGIEKYDALKRLEFHHCTKLETTDGIAHLSNSLENLHINTSKKLKITDELNSLIQLRVLRLNACGDIASLEFLKHLPHLVDFRFVHTNIADGNLDPILEHPSICSIGSFDKRHYNQKISEVEAALQDRRSKLALKKIVESNRENFAWPSSADSHIKT